MSGKKLSRERRMVGLTQHKLSQATGISVGRISFAETGRCELTSEEKQRIREVLRGNLLRAAEYLEARKLAIVRKVVGDRNAKIISL